MNLLLQKKLFFCIIYGICVKYKDIKPYDNTDVEPEEYTIEKLDGDAATFRVLVPNTDGCGCGQDYLATNSFFTMNLGCVCTIRCLNDTFIDCV